MRRNFRSPWTFRICLLYVLLLRHRCIDSSVVPPLQSDEALQIRRSHFVEGLTFQQGFERHDPLS